MFLQSKCVAELSARWVGSVLQRPRRCRVIIETMHSIRNKLMDVGVGVAVATNHMVKWLDFDDFGGG